MHSPSLISLVALFIGSTFCYGVVASRHNNKDPTTKGVIVGSRYVSREKGLKTLTPAMLSASHHHHPGPDRDRRSPERMQSS